MSIVSTAASCSASLCMLASLAEPQTVLHQVNVTSGSGGERLEHALAAGDVDGDADTAGALRTRVGIASQDPYGSALASISELPGHGSCHVVVGLVRGTE